VAGCNACERTTSASAIDAGFRRVLWIALGVNATMFVAEVIASFLAGSVSLQADALDFFGDATNYAISLSVLGMGINARARAALFKGATMAAFGLFVIGNAFYNAVVGAVPEPFIMGPVAVVALMSNIVVAIMLYRHRDGDSNRQSIWLCSRNDAIGNVAVILAASGVFATSTGWPDVLVAVVIAALNLSAARRVFVQARGELATTRNVLPLDHEAAQ